jgi:hypothetical protein
VLTDPRLFSDARLAECHERVHTLLDSQLQQLGSKGHLLILLRHEMYRVAMQARYGYPHHTRDFHPTPVAAGLLPLSHGYILMLYEYDSLVAPHKRPRIEGRTHEDLQSFHDQLIRRLLVDSRRFDRRQLKNRSALVLRLCAGCSRNIMGYDTVPGQAFFCSSCRSKHPPHDPQVKDLVLVHGHAAKRYVVLRRNNTGSKLIVRLLGAPQDKPFIVHTANTLHERYHSA